MPGCPTNFVSKLETVKIDIIDYKSNKIKNPNNKGNYNQKETKQATALKITSIHIAFSTSIDVA